MQSTQVPGVPSPVSHSGASSVQSCAVRQPARQALSSQIEPLGQLASSTQVMASHRDEVQAAASKIRQDKTLSEEERKGALATIRVETEKELTGLLGERRTRAYSANGGNWLRNLSPRE